MNKSQNIHVTTPLLWEEEDALQRVAKFHKVPMAGAMRLGLYKLIEEIEPRTVKALIRLRIGCQAVIKKAASLFTGSNPEKSVAWEDGLEKFKAEKANEVPTGGAALNENLLKLDADGTFEPTKEDK